jgi:amino acid permease
MKPGLSDSTIAISDVIFPLKSPFAAQTPQSESRFGLFYFGVLLSSSSIGISALAYPSSMARSGILLWVLLLGLAIVVNYISSYVLVYCGRETKSKDFGELTGKILGRGRIVVDFMCVALNLGIIISCIMTFNDFMTGIFQHNYFDGVSNVIVTSKKSLFWIIFPNLLLIPILLRRGITDMNAIAVGCVGAIVILAGFITFVFSTQNVAVDLKQLEYFNLRESPGSFSLLMFGFMNQQSIIDVFQDLSRKKIQTVDRILNYQNIMSSCLYIIIGLFGYLTFYNDQDIKTKNLFAFDLEKNLFYMIVNFTVGLSVLLSIVPTFRPTKNIILSYLPCPNSRATTNWNFMVTAICQLVLIIASCCFEVFDLNFLDIIDFVSVFVAPTICIYLPLIFYVKISKQYRFLLLASFVFVVNIFAIISF